MSVLTPHVVAVIALLPFPFFAVGVPIATEHLVRAMRHRRG